MMAASRALALLPLLLVVFSPPLQAQEANLLEFEVSIDQSFVVFPVGGQGTFVLTVKDISRDGPHGIAPQAPAGPAVLFHNIKFEVTPAENKVGWNINPPVGLTLRSGESRDYTFRISATPAASDPYYPANITVIMTSGEMEKRHTVDIVGYTPGLDGFNGQIGNTYTLKPRQLVDVPVLISNIGLYPRYFNIEVAENVCGLHIVAPATTLIDGRSRDEAIVSVAAPADKPYYFSDSCQVTLALSPADNPSQTQSIILVTQVEGWAVNPMWFFHATWMLLLLLLVILFVKRRKERLEEEILGKPQKPWTIPVEVVYLRHLKAKDERAWYVVRHHLMEEEYASSLLWFKAYKKATKGNRSKERLVIRQERDYEKWRAAWAKDIAKPAIRADKYDAKLQKKLDRKAGRTHKKEMRKYSQLTSKMQAAQLKREERALEKWAKEARRASKKGLAEPAKPKLPAPDYPNEPVLQPQALVDSRYAKRAARHRGRMVRKQGNLEVKFEKADARRHAKLERKVRRIARKLDDPQFIEEHPLLAEKAGNQA